MTYVVSTHSFLIVIEFDRDWGISNHHVLNRGYHFGIALVENGSDRSAVPADFIVYRGGDSVYEQDDRRLSRYRHEDGSYSVVDSRPLVGKFGDVHQLARANGGIYIVNSKYNSLVFEDLEHDRRHEYRFERGDRDRVHANSVYACGDEVFVLLHNRGRRESELVMLRHDADRGFEYARTLSLWNLGCHNVFIDGDRFFYNASFSREFVVVDLTNDRVVERIPFGQWHTKGMSVTQDYLVVGLSERTHRDNRSTSKAKLAVIDRHALSVVRMIDLDLPSLPHAIGNINDIRCLSGGELAHAHPTKTEADWSRLRFARRDRLFHFKYRAPAKLLLPLRRLKGFIYRGFQRA